MTSRILTGFDCANPAVWDSVHPESFKYRILVEGDSWMDRSTMLDPSLLPYLAKLFDKAKQSVLFINLARFGDTMAAIGRPCEFGKWQDLTLITEFFTDHRPMVTSFLGMNMPSNAFYEQLRTPASH